MNTEELQTLEIPLSKLLAWNDNVRTTGVEEGIGELADSIAAVGLLQGLVVKKEPRGKFAVIAGRRRLLALSRLAEEGKVKATMPVPCRIAPKDADLPEISLTENVMRVAMHPADEFEAFQRLIATGKSVAGRCRPVRRNRSRGTAEACIGACQPDVADQVSRRRTESGAPAGLHPDG